MPRASRRSRAASPAAMPSAVMRPPETATPPGRAGAPEGYGYSRFCELYEEWESRLSQVMRQVHPAGERLFVDYAGQTVELVDGRTGEVRTAQVFVAVLGASSYTYAEATWTQTLPDWIGAHARALAFFGGVPRQIVPDNLKQSMDSGRVIYHVTGCAACHNDPIAKKKKDEEEGAAAELFKAPKTDYTRALFAAAFKLETAPEGVVSQ